MSVAHAHVTHPTTPTGTAAQPAGRRAAVHPSPSSTLGSGLNSSGSCSAATAGEQYLTRRPSTVRRTPRRTGVLGHLNAEWATIGPRRTAPGWRADPRLAGLDTCQDVLDRISRERRGADVDAVMHALLTLHRDGDDLAGRTVLQTMLGKVARIANTARGRGLTDGHEAAVAAMWSVICDYPLRRTSSVAANLALDALRRLDSCDEAKETPIDQDELCRLEESFLETSHGDSGGDFDTVLVQTLTWAADHQILTEAEIQLLARVHLQTTDVGFTARVTAIADEMGLTFRCLQQRHHRAIARLARGVSDAMWAP